MGRPKKIAFEISARDKEATASLRRLSARFQKLMQPIDRLNRKLRANERALKPITQRLNRIGRSYRKFADKASLRMTLPLSLAGTAIAKTATGFETGMIKVKALTAATSDEFLRMRKLAVFLGSTTQFSAKEAAEGMSFLGMAGFKTSQIIAAIPGVLDLAAAAQLDLGEASDYASNILTGFGKKAQMMPEISDKLTYAFTNSNTTLTELHNGLAKVGGIATKAGVSFEDMTASMMALADAGHKGETAGIALAGALSRITKFSTADQANEVTKTLARLGINTGEFLDLNTGTFKIRFQDFIKLLDRNKAQLADYQKIFGQDVGKYIVGLSGQFNKLYNYLGGIEDKSRGLTKNISSMYMSGTGGAMKLLLSALEGFMVKLGDTGFLKVVNASLRSLSYLTAEISGLSKSFLRFSLIVAGVLVVFGPLAYGLGALVFFAKKLAVFLGATNLALLVMGGKLIMVTAGIAALVYGIWWAFKNTKRFTDILETFASTTVDIFYLFQYEVKKAINSLVNFAVGVANEILEVLEKSGLGFLFGGKSIQIPGIKISPPQLPSESRQKHPALPAIKWAPDWITRGFSDVFGSADEPSKSGSFNFQEFRKEITQTNVSDKGELDVNINLSGVTKDVRLETKNRSRARVTLDTGRIMVGG